MLSPPPEPSALGTQFPNYSDAYGSARAFGSRDTVPELQ